MAARWIAASSNERSLATFSIPSSGAPQGIATWKAGQAYESARESAQAASSKESDWTDWLGFTVQNIAPSTSAISFGDESDPRPRLLRRPI